MALSKEQLLKLLKNKNLRENYIKQLEQQKTSIKTAKAKKKKSTKKKTWAEMSPLERIKERKRKTDETIKKSLS